MLSNLTRTWTDRYIWGAETSTPYEQHIGEKAFVSAQLNTLLLSNADHCPRFCTGATLHLKNRVGPESNNQEIPRRLLIPRPVSLLRGYSPVTL